MPTTEQTIHGKTRIHYTTKETAQCIREALKVAFPGVKFSVTTSYASMTSSTNVSWTDGPTDPEVERITDRFSSKSFDGMTDSTNYHSQTVNGQTVSYSGWIHTTRYYTVALLTLALARFQTQRAEYGLPPADLTIVENGRHPYTGGPDRDKEAGVSQIGYRYDFRSCAEAVQSIAYHLRPNGCIVRLKAVR